MKTLQISAFLGALSLPLSAYAHPGHDGVFAELTHLFASVDPLWGGITGGLVMIFGAWWIGRRRT